MPFLSQNLLVDLQRDFTIERQLPRPLHQVVYNVVSDFVQRVRDNVVIDQFVQFTGVGNVEQTVTLDEFIDEAFKLRHCSNWHQRH